MAKLEPLAIMMFLFRMAPAILFILFMMIVFFSFRVDVRNDDMGRFLQELADSVTSSPLAGHKSVFSPQKLTEAEQRENRNIELYSVNCDYGYTIKVEALTGRVSCGSSCSSFCSAVCGTTGSESCGCNAASDCQCKKFDEWHDSYEWEYGYTASRGRIAAPSAEFPVGISQGDGVLPAKMTLTAYDSFLTRLACVTKKAYELKENHSVRFNMDYATRNAVFRRAGGTHVCMYFRDTPYDCRYFPDVDFLEFRTIFPPNIERGMVTAYPLTTPFALCDNVKTNPGIIAGKDDNVATVLLCAGAAR